MGSDCICSLLIFLLCVASHSRGMNLFVKTYESIKLF